MRPVLLVDCDDVLFPLQDSFSRWAHSALPHTCLDTAASVGCQGPWTSVHLSSVLGDGGSLDADLSRFFATTSAQVAPSVACVQALDSLSADFRVVVAIERAADVHGALVGRWLVEHFGNAIDDAFCTRLSAGSPRVSKAQLCSALGAVAMIDDCASSLRKLGDGVLPVVFDQHAWGAGTSAVRLPSWAGVRQVLAHAF